MLSLKSRFWWKKLLFFVSDLFLYFSVELYFRLLFCGVYNFLMENTHRKKKKCVSVTHEKKKMKTALHDSFVILLLFFIFVSSENPKSSTFTNQACWCNYFFATFPKKKNSLNFFVMYKFQKEKQKTFSYFTLTKLKTRCWIQSKTCPTDLKVQEQIKMFIQGLKEHP